MFAGIGKLVFQHKKAVIGFWAVLLIAGGIFAPRTAEYLSAGGFELPTAESVIAGDELAAKFNGSRSYMTALFTAPAGTRADSPEYAAKVDAAVAGLRSYKSSQQVLTFASTKSKDFVSADGKYTYALLGFDLTYEQTQNNLKNIRPLIKPGDLDMKLTGLPVIYEDFNRISQEDAEKAELLTFPLALIILLVVFRTVVAAAMPLMMAGVSVVITLGALFFIAQASTVSIFVLNIATLLGLGMGIDYALLIVSRYREELYHSNGDIEKAIITTTRTAGKAVFFSGLTVLIGMGSLLLSKFSVLQSIGIGGLFVVGINVLAALTLLPAVLGLLGKRVNAWRLPFLAPIETQLAKQSTGQGFWHRLAIWVSRRPIAIMVVVLVFLLWMGSPFLHVRFGEPTFQALPEETPSRQAAEVLEANFPSYGRNSDLFVLLKSKSGLMTDPANTGALYDYAKEIKARFPEITRVTAAGQDLLAPPLTKEQLVQLLGLYGSNSPLLPAEFKEFAKATVNGNSASLRLSTSAGYSTQPAVDLVNNLRAYQPAPLSVQLAGEQPGLMDFVKVLYADFPVAVAIVVVITYLILFFLFQSVLLPIKAVIMTGLSLCASYGALVFIFQDGNLTGLFNTVPLGYVEATLPILLFAILFGLSMDYEVFMLSRIKEFYDETGDNSKSVALGLERTGSTITSAALIIVVVAGAFGTADIVVIKAVGIGMALAVALDATIVRALLVPATMELLGKANWWAPAFIKRLLPKISHE